MKTNAIWLSVAVVFGIAAIGFVGCGGGTSATTGGSSRPAATMKDSMAKDGMHQQNMTMDSHMEGMENKEMMAGDSEANKEMKPAMKGESGKMTDGSMDGKKGAMKKEAMTKESTKMEKTRDGKTGITNVGKKMMSM